MRSLLRPFKCGLPSPRQLCPTVSARAARRPAWREKDVDVPVPIRAFAAIGSRIQGKAPYEIVERFSRPLFRMADATIRHHLSLIV